MAKEGIEIPDEEWPKAPTPFLKGYRSVLPSPEKEDDEEVIFGERFQEPLRRRERPRKQQARYKPKEKERF